MTYDPNHLRQAAEYLDTQDMYNASTVLRTAADAIQKQKLEDDLNLRVGQHFRELVKKRNGWTFNAVSDADIRKFGEAAREAVAKHGPKSVGTASVEFGVGGNPGVSAAARSPYPPR